MNNFKKILLTVIFSFLILSFLSFTALDKDDTELKVIKQKILDKGANWEAAETSISKLSPYERKKRLGAIITFRINQEDIADFKNVIAVPDSLDWRNNNGLNWVTCIKNQLSCGSCWAFGVVAAIESRYNIEKNGLFNQTFYINGIFKPMDGKINYHLNLSEQYLVSCSDAGDCDGGYEDLAVKWINKYGVPTENCFPYEGKNLPCKPCDNWESKVTTIDDWGYVTTDQANRDNIINALVSGPVSTYLTIYSDFYYYNSGVYQHTYGTLEGGHIVAIVGYNQNQNYWICKNSWGTHWGEKGFFRIKMGDSSEIGKWTIYVRGIQKMNPVKAPINLIGQKNANYSLTQKEYLDELTWQANPDNSKYNVLSYYIYQVSGDEDKKISEVDVNTCSFLVRNVPNIDSVYAICAYTVEHKAGRRAYVTVKMKEN